MRDGMDGIDTHRNPRMSQEEYLSVRWLLSKRTFTWTPRCLAATSAFAIGAEVKE
jgi:hypothetical protein